MRADLREARGRRSLGEVDRVDREQAPRRIQRASAHVDEIPQPVEKVREVVEVALKLDRDRDRQVTRDRRRGRRWSDLLERDSAVLGDLVQLENDPRHVDLVGHRLREPVEVGDTDPCTLLRLQRQRAGSGDGVVRVRDLFVEVAGVGALRPDHQEPAAEADQHEAERDQRDQQRLRDAALHCPLPGARTSATITKWTAFEVPTLASVLCWSWTLTRSGTTASLLNRRATAGCEYV